MSPVGDLALSPRGLRVPARARFFSTVSAEDLVVDLRRSWASFGDCAVPRRENAVLGGGVLLRGFPQEIQGDSVWGFNLYQWEIFRGVCGPIPAYIIWHLRWAWRDNVFP